MPHAPSRWVLAPIIVAFLLCVALTYAEAHGSYEIQCCHDRDCAPIENRHAREADGGVYITLGPKDHPMMAREPAPKTWFVPRDKFRRPLNGEWHACLSSALEMLCVYPPAQGA